MHVLLVISKSFSPVITIWDWICQGLVFTFAHSSWRCGDCLFQSGKFLQAGLNADQKFCPHCQLVSSTRSPSQVEFEPSAGQRLSLRSVAPIVFAWCSFVGQCRWFQRLWWLLKQKFTYLMLLALCICASTSLLMSNADLNKASKLDDDLYSDIVAITRDWIGMIDVPSESLPWQPGKRMGYVPTADTTANLSTTQNYTGKLRSPSSTISIN